jgi:hypothetical protein
MARPKISKKTASSKKLKRSVEKKKRAAVPKPDSESNASSLPQVRPPIVDQESDEMYYSDDAGERSQRSPPLSSSPYRSPERTSPDGSQERSDHRSPERNSLHRSAERTSRQSSRSSVRSNPDAAEPSDEDLLFTGHFPANPAGAEIGASAAVPANQGEKFTASPAIPPPRIQGP